MQPNGSPVTCDFVFIGRASGRGCTRWFPLLTATDPCIWHGCGTRPLRPDPGGRSVQEVGPEGDRGVLMVFRRLHRATELVVEVVDQIGAVVNDVRLIHRQHRRTGSVWMSQQVPVRVDRHHDRDLGEVGASHFQGLLSARRPRLPGGCKQGDFAETSAWEAAVLGGGFGG